MALAELLKELERGAQIQVAAMLQAARAEADRMAAASEAEVARQRARLLATRTSGARARAAEAEALAAQRAAADVLRARTRLVERVFAEAERGLPGAVASAAYAAALPVHVAEVLRYAADESVTLRCTPSLVARVAAMAKGRNGTRVEADPSVASGIELRADDGRYLVDNTLRGRIERMRPALGAAVLGRAPPT